jgi:hypothetical protein
MGIQPRLQEVKFHPNTVPFCILTLREFTNRASQGLAIESMRVKNSDV